MLSSTNSKITNKRGRFIVIDGAEGTGKTTQAAILAARLRDRGRFVFEVREPGSTFIGEQIRSVILDVKNKGMLSTTELLLFMACRNELLVSIRRALDGGAWVICDRYIGSTYAYQQHTTLTQVFGLADLVLVDQDRSPCWKPDLCLILDLPVAERRIKDVRDRIEQKSEAYHEAVRNRFRKLEGFMPDVFRVLCVEGMPVASVTELILKELRSLC